MELKPTTATSTRSPESREKARVPAREARLRVGAAEGVEPDRRHSLQQELNEMEAEAAADFEGQATILRSTHDMARQLAQLSTLATRLIKPADALHLSPSVLPGVDETA